METGSSIKERLIEQSSNNKIVAYNQGKPGYAKDRI